MDERSIHLRSPSIFRTLSDFKIVDVPNEGYGKSLKNYEIYILP